MKKRVKVIILMLVILAANIGCDQLTKEYARRHFRNMGTINVVSDLFVIRYAENSGAFLGLGKTLRQPFKNIIMIFIPLIMMSAILLYTIIKNIPYAEKIPIFCIIGGGISNLYDRIIFDGYVTDFMNFGIMGIRTGILNMADISVTFGAVFLIIHYRFQKKPSLENHP